MQKNNYTTRLVTTSILAAISSILFLIDIPLFMFYKLDLSNIAVLLGSFLFGPLYSFIILFIKDLTGLLHSSTGGIGELADFITAIPFVLLCGIIYKNKKSFIYAVIAMIISTLLSAILGILVNYHILIPLFLPDNGLIKLASQAQEVFPFVDSGYKFLLFITGPFNIIKGLVISIITTIIYKRLSNFIFRSRI